MSGATQFRIPSQILIATNNRGKFPEIESLLKKVDIEAVPAFSFNLEEPEEIGTSFAENSLIKARYYALKTNLVALADDSGFCVEDLGGIPGIHAARFALDEKTGEKNFPLAFEKIFSQLRKKGIDLTSKPKCHFVCNLTLFDPKNGFSISFEGKVDGFISPQPLGNRGFGYDPIFIKNDMNQTFAEISPEEKDQISHRADAFKKMVAWLVKTDQKIT